MAGPAHIPDMAKARTLEPIVIPEGPRALLDKFMSGTPLTLDERRTIWAWAVDGVFIRMDLPQDVRLRKGEGQRGGV